MLTVEDFTLAVYCRHRVRREGRLQGKRPYDVLGVDVKQAGQRWYDVVLDAEAQAA